MSKRLQDKASLIALAPSPLDQALNRSTPSSEAPRAKTAPGTMLGFMNQQSAAVQEAEQLRERLKAFEGASPSRPLDPRTIEPSKWANRHSKNFEGEDFEWLKEEIRQAGGNVQPIKVRPKTGVLNGSTPPVDVAYEIVFGHRRHRACLELGIPVNAIVEEATDQQLFEQMERENRGRKNLSAWEQGTMYRQALDEGLYPSQRKLSEALGVDLAMVSKSLSLARLPPSVIAAFPTPMEIQYRWAQPLSEAIQKDPDGTLAKAQSLLKCDPRPGAAEVFNALTGRVLNRSTPRVSGASPAKLARHGKTLATLNDDAKGRAVLRFESGVLPESKRKSLLKLIDDFLKTP